MNTFLLTISTPDGNIFNDQAEGLFLRGESGDLAVLAGHAPFITSVKPCELHIDLPVNDTESEDYTKTGRVSGGLLTVSKDGAVLVTPSFEWI